MTNKGEHRCVDAANSGRVNTLRRADRRKDNLEMDFVTFVFFVR